MTSNEAYGRYGRTEHRRHDIGVGLGLQGLNDRARVDNDLVRDEESVYESEDQADVRARLASGKRRSQERRQSREYRDDVDRNDGRMQMPDEARRPNEDDYRQRSRRRSTESDKMRRRREEALIGLVSGLQFDGLLQSQSPEEQRPVRSGGDQGNFHNADYLEDDNEFTRSQTDDTRKRRKSKDGDGGRQRMTTQPSRLPTSSKARIEDLSQNDNANRDHRRSISLPPKSRRSSRTENVDTFPPRDTRGQYSRRQDTAQEHSSTTTRRTSTGLAEAQTSTHRSSVLEREDAAAVLKPSGGRRRSSSNAVDSQFQSNRRRESLPGDRNPDQEKRNAVYSHERERRSDRGYDHARGPEYAYDPAQRERQAFGIPESLSYVGHEALSPTNAEGHERSPDYHGEGSVAEQDPRDLTVHSTPERDRWDEANQSADGFSTAAQALFRKLEGRGRSREGDLASVYEKEGTKDDHRRMSSSRRTSGAVAHARTRSSQYEQERHEMRELERRLSGTVSASSSAPSVYEEVDEVLPEQHFPRMRTPPDRSQLPAGSSEYRQSRVSDNHNGYEASWRATMRSETYDTLLRTYGAAEIERQELIYVYVCAHNTYIRLMRSLVRVFIVPLRRKHSKVWLPGVPKDVARLFDWLEDIVNLHSALEDTLQSLTEPWNRGEPVAIFSQGVRGIVPRLEVYQPYVVRVESVRETVMKSMRDRQEFGEFVSLREGRGECGGLPLTELLLLPTDQLHSSVETFQVCSHGCVSMPLQYADIHYVATMASHPEYPL